MNEDIDSIIEMIESFARVENITDIVILGDNGGIRRLEIEDEG